MVSHVQLTLLTLVFLVVPPGHHGQLLSNEDNPSLLDRVLQVVWEPSSLIRMWVGLDQLYNIARSWRGVAKKIASLPFGEGRSMDHVRIQEPRSFKYPKPSGASQWDRFNEIYSSSNLSPIVADAKKRLMYRQLRNGKFLGGGGNNLQMSGNSVHEAFQTDPNSVAVFGLPPPSLFLPQEEFASPSETLDFLMKSAANELDGSLLLPQQFGVDPAVVASLLELQKNEKQRVLRDRRVSKEPPGGGGEYSMIPKLLAGGQGGVLNGGPQERLNTFLKLMKTLGDMHSNEIRRESAGNGDR